MRRILALFLLLLLSVWVGLYLHQGMGIIFIVLKQWTIQVPIWFVLIAWIIGYGVFILLFKILKNILHIGQSLRYCKQTLQRRYARLNTRRGLIEFTEGNWKEAEHHLIKAVPNSDTSLLNYLAAARAAQELAAPERRDEYLREAQKNSPDARIAIELTQAQLQMANEQWEQALATLNHLHSLSPHHPYVIKLLIKVYLTLKDWIQLEKWLPPIRRQKMMPEKAFIQLEKKVYTELLEYYAKQDNVETFCTQWMNFPKNVRQSSDIVTLYVAKLLYYHADDQAEIQCREALQREWSESLILLYGRCVASDIHNQLRFAERCLKSHPNSVYLLLTLGRICIRCQLWGKAKGYLLQSIQHRPEVETYVELAQLAENRQESEVAGQYYKASMALALAERRTPSHESTFSWDSFYCLAGKIIV